MYIYMYNIYRVTANIHINPSKHAMYTSHINIQ